MFLLSRTDHAQSPARRKWPRPSRPRWPSRRSWQVCALPEDWISRSSPPRKP